LHGDQRVSAPLGGVGHPVSRPDRATDRAGGRGSVGWPDVPARRRAAEAMSRVASLERFPGSRRRWLWPVAFGLHGLFTRVIVVREGVVSLRSRDRLGSKA